MRNHVIDFPSPANRARSEAANILGAACFAYGSVSALGQMFGAAAGAAANGDKWPAFLALAAVGLALHQSYAPMITGALENRRERRNGPHTVLEFHPS